MLPLRRASFAIAILVLLAPPQSAPRVLVQAATEPLFSDASSIILGVFFVTVGLLAIVLAVVRRHANVVTVLAFGLFTGMYGARLLITSYLPLLLQLEAMRLDRAEWLLTYMMPLPGWVLARRLIGAGWRNSLVWQVRAFAVFGVAEIIFDAFTHPGAAQPANNVVVIIGAVNLFANLLRLRHSRSVELRALLAASAFFLLLAANDNLIGLGMLPWKWRDEKIGFLVFVATLGWATLRAFVASERQLFAIEGELRTARDIQQSLLPRAMPATPAFRFDARYDPASSVAGDLYDFIAVDERHVGTFVADVSGHGVPAALIASMVKVGVSSQARSASEPALLVGELNRILCADVRKAFVTATYLFFDADDRSVTVTNAGHPSPLLHRAAGGTIEELGPHGVLLGRFTAARYTSATYALASGDRIVAFTDGVTEARNARDEQFGEERLHELLRAGASSAAIADAVEAWRGDAGEDVDDVTVVVIEVV